MAGLLQFTNCGDCNKQYIVGINGKLVKQTEDADPSAYYSDGEKVPKEFPCRGCGKICKVEDSAD